jgi:hypothetical protein
MDNFYASVEGGKRGSDKAHTLEAFTIIECCQRYIRRNLVLRAVGLVREDWCRARLDK